MCPFCTDLLPMTRVEFVEAKVAFYRRNHNRMPAMMIVTRGQLKALHQVYAECVGSSPPSPSLADHIAKLAYLIDEEPVLPTSERENLLEIGLLLGTRLFFYDHPAAKFMLV